MKNRTFLCGFLTAALLVYSLPEVLAQVQGDAIKTAASLRSTKEYKIGSGDILDIMTWKEPELTRANVLVRIDGKISFPLVGDIQAAGLTPIQLKNQIQAGLNAYVSGPAVTVSISSPNSQKFYILGEVGRTGEYNITKHLTVLQAFALAGGFTQWASKKEIILLRIEGGQEKMFRVNYKKIVKGEDLGQNIEIKADDTIIVP